MTLTVSNSRTERTKKGGPQGPPFTNPFFYLYLTMRSVLAPSLATLQ